MIKKVECFQNLSNKSMPMASEAYNFLFELQLWLKFPHIVDKSISVKRKENWNCIECNSKRLYKTLLQSQTTVIYANNTQNRFTSYVWVHLRSNIFNAYNSMMLIILKLWTERKIQVAQAIDKRLSCDEVCPKQKEKR